jgi:hypothetical protein
MAQVDLSSHTTGSVSYCGILVCSFTGLLIAVEKFPAIEKLALGQGEQCRLL